MPEQLGNLVALGNLSLDVNAFTGEPLFYQLNNCMTSSNYSINAPQFHVCQSHSDRKQLNYSSASPSAPVGPIPKGLSLLRNLLTLSLAENQLTGECYVRIRMRIDFECMLLDTSLNNKIFHMLISIRLNFYKNSFRIKIRLRLDHFGQTH